MPKKYHVTIQDVPPRFAPVSRFAAIEADGCLGCLRCVKRDSCMYDVYSKRSFDPTQIADTADATCVACMRCVQECKKAILTRVVDRDYAQMGDAYWQPAMIESIWKQSRTGTIPVSGAGYRGPFVGEGFDRIWTDMSEIVRPTRDGIHGREYISTLVDLGRRPESLAFDDAGRLTTTLPAALELPIPMLLDLPAWPVMSPAMREAVVRAAAGLQTLAILDLPDAEPYKDRYVDALAVRFDPARDDADSLGGYRLVELADADDVLDTAATVREACPDTVISIRLPLDEHAADRTAALTAGGAENIHLQAGRDGYGLGSRTGQFLTTLVREVHDRLVADRVRDLVSVVVTGGIGMSEHVAKAILCGADGVGVDVALLVALECRLCPTCPDGAGCPAMLTDIPVEWGAQRIVNLMGSWHAQLLEVLGAMGIREVRRLRGEVGRAIFFEDIEAESFAPLFGTRQDGAGDEPSRGSAPDPSAYSSAGTFVEDCPSRFRNQLSRYRVVRTAACIACGKCQEVCTYGVHRMAGPRMLAPRGHLCRGTVHCKAAEAFCVDVCPVDALRVGPNPAWETFGDPRWPAELLSATWHQAATGLPPADGREYRVGLSGGGFDRIEICLDDTPPDAELNSDDIDLSISLNRSGDGRPEVKIGMPIYGGGMSYGSIGVDTIVARARAYKAMNSLTCTGEGGFPDELAPYSDNVITQVATGLFGVREETIQRVPMVEFKYAQGAKPGLGGHLLGDKVTDVVARIREAVKGSSLFSPFPFHSVYSVEDHKKHVDWIKVTSPKALVSVKVSTPSDVDMVAVGSYYAGAHVIHIDGSYGGTGAAPDIAKKNIAMPLEYAIPKVSKFLIAEGIREKITLIASGGIRSAWDVAKAIALGADGVVIGTAEMVALECIRCGVCESGRGCPRGIATTDPELSVQYDQDWATQRLINLLSAWCAELRWILQRLGMRSVRELVGRTDVLRHLDYVSSESESAKPAQAARG